jgi:hypothetical protein
MSKDRVIVNRAGGDLIVKSHDGYDAMVVSTEGATTFSQNVTFSGGTTGGYCNCKQHRS